MARYTCQRCGAGHKEKHSHCRMCGAPMTGDMILQTPVGDQTMSADRFKSRSLAPVAFAVLGALVIAVFGAVRAGILESQPIEDLLHKVPGVYPDQADGWTEWTDPGGVFVAEAPGEPTATEPPAVAASGTVLAYEATVGGDQVMTFGYTDGAGLTDTGDEVLESTSQSLVAGLGGRIEDDTTEHDFAGRPALDVVATNFNRAHPYMSIRLIRFDDEVLFVITEANVAGTTQHYRIADSIQFTADLAPQAEPAG